MQLPWLQDVVKRWKAQSAGGRLPHAVMLAGPPGVGKRAVAAWMVRDKLGVGSDNEEPTWPYERPEHADLRWLTRPEDKHSILIEQIRDLVSALALTSYEGHGKAAVIDPANALNPNAANSLLKTLEEPPGDALLILIADRTGRLPATIVSRCQRINVLPPSEGDALKWLDGVRPGTSWGEALRHAGMAPLGALRAEETADTTRGLARDFAAVGEGDASPVDIAQTWSKNDVGDVLEWLAREVAALARLAVAGRQTGSGRLPGESVLPRIDSRNLFCYLDNINRLRGQQSGSFNVQLALEGLLIDWATGLAGVRDEPVPSAGDAGAAGTHR